MRAVVRLTVSSRTGVPVTVVFAPLHGARSAVCRQATARCEASGATRVFDRPACTFPSQRRLGVRVSHAAISVGMAMYPPVEKITSGRTRRIRRIACGIDQSSLAASRAVATRPAPLGRRLGAAKSVNVYPASGTRRDSTPRAPPSQLISASEWSWRTVRATANAGKRCPPVPPPAISTRITTSCLTWIHRLTRYREEQPNCCHQNNE